MNRREFIKLAGAGVLGLAADRLGLAKNLPLSTKPIRGISKRKPNIVFVFADQMRAQAAGYAGDPNVKTPNLDKLADKSVNFINAVSGYPICCPYRASLITGQYCMTNGMVTNDLYLKDNGASVAEAFKQGGYDTGYIGKWHLNGGPWEAYIPRERRKGFDFWRALECTHDYNNSHYYADDDPVMRTWKGYDAIAQTREAMNYINQHSDTNKPFLLMLSYGPPHNPYGTAPDQFKAMYDPHKIKVRPNVPENSREGAQKNLAGYYAHISAIDMCVGMLFKHLQDKKLSDNTIFVFTSDHGDMLQSLGYYAKQSPFEESVRVPFLLHYPAGTTVAKQSKVHIDVPDIMPTLLGLAGLPIPKSVQGADCSAGILENKDIGPADSLLRCYCIEGPWKKRGGLEYRGLRNDRYTYVRYLSGPAFLFDNIADPYQMNNLVNKPEVKTIQSELDKRLTQKITETNETLLPTEYYFKKYGFRKK